MGFAFPVRMCNDALVEMNVTIKIQEELGRAARHKAVDAGLSLSGWISTVIAKELSLPKREEPSRTLLDALGNEALAEMKLDFPRDQSGGEPLDFS